MRTRLGSPRRPAVEEDGQQHDRGEGREHDAGGAGRAQKSSFDPVMFMTSQFRHLVVSSAQPALRVAGVHSSGLLPRPRLYA